MVEKIIIPYQLLCWQEVRKRPGKQILARPIRDHQSELQMQPKVG
jgi:hypothetical protein